MPSVQTASKLTLVPKARLASNASLWAASMPIDIHARLSLCIAQLLGIFENGLVRQALLAHLGQDVMAGPVESSINMNDRISGQPFAQGLDDGNAAGNRCFVVQGDTCRLSRGASSLP